MRDWIIGKKLIWAGLIYFTITTASLLYIIIGVIRGEYNSFSATLTLLEFVIVSVIVLIVFLLPFPYSLIILGLRVYKKSGNIRVNTERKYLISYLLNIALIVVSVYFYLKTLPLNLANLIVVTVLISGNLHSGHRRFLIVWHKLLWIKGKLKRNKGDTKSQLPVKN